MSRTSTYLRVSDICPHPTRLETTLQNIRVTKQNNNNKMGSPSTAASAVSAPTANQVAESFIAVYYRVASTLPARLPQLYGPDSALTHGPLVAQGSAIKAAAPRIPLAGRRLATVAHMSVQQTASAGYLVNVIGTYELDDGKRSVFAQSFVLERQMHSHNEHFYCRNDLFVEMNNVDLPGKVPELKTGKEDQPTQEKEQTDNPQHVVKDALDVNPKHTSSNEVADTIKIDKVPVDTRPVPVANTHQEQKLHDSNSVQSVVTPDQSSGTSDEHTASVDIRSSADVKPETQVNGVVEAAQKDDKTHQKPTVDASLDTPASPKEQDNDNLTNGVLEEDAQAKSSPPTKKSWAAVVSTKDAAVAANEAQANTASPPQKPASPVVKTKSRTPSPDQAKPVATMGVPGQETQGPNLHQVHHGRHMQNGHTGHNGNHHRNNYNTGRGNYARRFGPSAVVHLSSLKPAQLQDPRQLSMDLKAEFSQYGHRLRHVEVKTQKGIAFIEYDTMDGVRAAVDMWARGARQEGAFAGIPLSVSEKHSYNKWRPNSMRGGGRGGVRGGGRRNNRPASTQIS